MGYRARMKKLKLRSETVRALTSSDLQIVAGGRNTNLTCQDGCASIDCHTHRVSCPASCPIRCTLPPIHPF